MSGGWTQGWVDPADREPCEPCHGTGLHIFTDYARYQRNLETIERIKRGEGRWRSDYALCGACHGEGYWRRRGAAAVRRIA